MVGMVEKVAMVAMVVMVVMVVVVVMMMMAINPKYAQGKDARRLEFVLYQERIPHYTAWLA